MVTRDEMKTLTKDFRAMDGDQDGWVTTKDAALAQLPPKVWRGIMKAATADVAGTPTRLSFAEYALLSLTHGGNKEAERQLLLVRAGCAFDHVAELPRLAAGKQAAEAVQGKAATPPPPPRGGRVRRKSTLDRTEAFKACQLLGELANETEFAVGPRIAKLGRVRRGRIARKEFLKLVLEEHPDLESLSPLKILAGVSEGEMPEEEGREGGDGVDADHKWRR